MTVPEIDIAEAAARHAAGATVIDVREPHEYVEGHVPGARLIPLGEIAERAGEVPSDSEILMICRSGARSLKAGEILRSYGLQVINVSGGTLAWIDAGHRVVQGEEPGE